MTVDDNRMTTPSTNLRFPRAQVAAMDPQELIRAVAQDPQAVLQYIIRLENENQRLHNHLDASREEMSTVVQNALSSIASEMTKTLQVTKKSLISVQKEFNRIAIARHEDLGVDWPAILRHNEDEPQVLSPPTANTRDEGIITVFGNTSRNHPASPFSRQFDQLSCLPGLGDLKADENKIDHKTTDFGPEPGSSLMFDLLKEPEVTTFPSTDRNVTLPCPATPTIIESCSVRVDPYSSAFIDVHPLSSKQIEASKAKPALVVRSKSQQNVQKLDSKPATEEFIAYMTGSHKQHKSYQNSPQAKSRGSTGATINSYASAVEELKATHSEIESKLVRQTGPLIRYDIESMKNIGLECRRQSNPFLGNQDEELRPVLEWGTCDKYFKDDSKYQPRHLFRGGAHPKTQGWL